MLLGSGVLSGRFRQLNQEPELQEPRRVRTLSVKGYVLLGVARFLASCLAELYPSWDPFQPIRELNHSSERTTTDKIGQIEKTFVIWLTPITPQDERKMNKSRRSVCRFALFWKVCPASIRTSVRLPSPPSRFLWADSSNKCSHILIIRHARPRSGLSTGLSTGNILLTSKSISRFVDKCLTQTCLIFTR